MNMDPADKEFFSEGVRFECTGCGACCTSRGENRWVYATLPERRRLADLLGISTAIFTRRFCTRTDGFWHFKNMEGGCQFLLGKRCSVYSARPDQCRSFPWWSQNLTRKAWEQEVQPGCEGVGRGRVYKLAEIEPVLQVERERYFDRS